MSKLPVPTSTSLSPSGWQSRRQVSQALNRANTSIAEIQSDAAIVDAVIDEVFSCAEHAMDRNTRMEAREAILADLAPMAAAGNRQIGTVAVVKALDAISTIRRRG